MRPDPVQLRVLLYLYRRLVLPLHPRKLREEYADEIVDELGASLREARARGESLLRVGLAALADVRETRRLSAAPAARRERPRSGRASTEPRSVTPAAGHAIGPPAASTSPGIFGTLVDDLRAAVRGHSRRPAFILAALSILAVGIGANTGVFSLLDAYLLGGLPYPDPDRVVRITPFPRDTDFREWLPILEQLETVEWPTEDPVFEHLVSWNLDGFTVLGGERPEAVLGSWVTPGFFGALGVEPALGRGFSRAEGEPGREAAAVISHRLWQRHFGGDADVLGRSFTAFSTDRPEAAESFTIIGVLPRDFWYFNRFTDLLLPLDRPPSPSIARLRPGVSYEQAAEHLTALVADQIDTDGAPGWHMGVAPLHEVHVRGVRPVLVAMMVAVGLVLIIACGNVAILLLVRAMDRERDLTLRRALGASRGRIARQLVAEGVVLSVAAGGLGLLLARLGLDALAPLVQGQLGTSVPGGLEQVGIDLAVLGATLVASLVTGVGFGLVPAVTARRGDLAALLAEGGRGTSSGPRRRTARNLLIAAEVGLSLALLLGAGLMARSALHLGTLDLGFEPDRLLKANVSLRRASYPEPLDRIEFIHELIAGAEALPEVEDAAIVNPYPFRPGSNAGSPVEGEGGEESVEAALQVVSPGYFETMGVTLLRGRLFDERDAPPAAPTAIVSEELAARLWPGQDPLGRSLRAGDDPAGMHAAPWGRVVGVVGDVRKSLTGDHVPDLYLPHRQAAPGFFFVMLRTRGDPLVAAPGLARVVTAIDPQQPVGEAEPMAAVVAGAGSRPRFLASVLAGFSVFAACLAVFGLYAVIAYAVAQRRRDVAVRMALGASREQVVGLFVRQGMIVVGLGMLGGLIGSRWLGRFLESQLFGVSTLDPLTYALVCGVLLIATSLAIWLPARRAAACDPMRILREE